MTVFEGLRAYTGFLRAFPWIPGLISFARNDGFLMWLTFIFFCSLRDISILCDAVALCLSVRFLQAAKIL
jgi:hypothetical protein